MVAPSLATELPVLAILCSRAHDSLSEAPRPQSGPEKEHSFPDVSWHQSPPLLVATSKSRSVREESPLLGRDLEQPRRAGEGLSGKPRWQVTFCPRGGVRSHKAHHAGFIYRREWRDMSPVSRL